MIEIDLKNQSLKFLDERGEVSRWSISSAVNGVGEQNGSGCTPRGRHRIFSKIGDGAPINSVFIARQWTGEIYSAQLAHKHPQRDWVLTRILQLDGLETGFNRYGLCDSLTRYIYIHGTPDTVELGKPNSKGCIRMHNADLINLFNRVKLNTLVHMKAD